MMLIRTSENSGHDHIAYQREDETGSTSVAHGHFHDILTEIVDPTAGMTEEERTAFFEVDPNPPEETRIVITTAGKDKHTHSLTDDFIFAEDTDVTDPDNDDVKLASELRGLWSYAKEAEQEFRKSGDESEDFYFGKQWNVDEKKKLENAKRAALTINEIGSRVDILSGFHRQNRSDIKYFPVGKGDARVADMLTAIVKNILNTNNFIHEENQVFEDKTIVGRGLYDCFINHDKNLLGDIIVEKYPWDGVWFGPHDKYDLSDCEYIIKSKWFSFLRIKEMYPDKAEDLTRDYDAQFQQEGKREDPIKENKGAEYANADNFLALKHSTDFFDITRKDYRILEVDRKLYKRVYVVFHARDDFYLNAEGISKKDIDAIETITGFRSVPRVVTHMKTVISAGNVILDEHIEDEEDTFSIVPDYAKKRRDRVWGKVEPAKDPQREINKRTSQSIDIVNKAAGYGWIYDNETFDTPRDEKNFKRNAGTPGFTAKVKDVARIPVKVEGVRFPSEIVQLGVQAREGLDRVMNTPPELQGRSQRIESGAALREKKAAGLVGNEYLFDNSSIAKGVLGRKILKMLQKFYSVDRLQRLLSDQTQRGAEDKQPLTLTDKGKQTPIGEFSDEEIFEMLNKADLSQYDVVVGESPYNETNRRSNFFTTLEVARVVPGIPPATLIGLSDIPNKEAVIDSINAAEKQRQDEVNAKNQTEIAKTAIAQEGKGGGGGEE